MKVMLLPCFRLSRMETSLEPLLATTKSESSVAVDIGHGDPDRVGAGEEPLAAVQLAAELALAQAGIHKYVVAAAVGDDQVLDAVTVEVGQLHRAGRQQALGAVPYHGLLPPP